MKTNLWKIAAALFIGAAASVTSCDPVDEEPQDVAPIFPELTTVTVETGESYDLTINPNLDWTVKITGHTHCFELISNGEPFTEVKGKAGEQHTLTIKSLDDNTDFGRECKLVMTMAGIEQVIAIYKREGKEEQFQVWTALFGDTGFEDGEDVGGKEYETEPNYDLKLQYDGNVVQTYIKVLANFDWKLISWPEWAEPKEIGSYVKSGKADEPAAIRIEGVNANFPITDETLTADLVFALDDEAATPTLVTIKVTLSLEPVNRIFNVTLADGRFNNKGWYYNEMSGGFNQWNRMSGSITGVSGIKYYAVEKQGETYAVIGSAVDEEVAETPGWVKLQVSDDSWEETDVLKDWAVMVSVAEYSEEVAREADIIIVPSYFELQNEDMLFNADKTAISDAVLPFVASHIIQEGKVIGGNAVTADNEALAEAGATFEKLDPTSSENEWIAAVDRQFEAGEENYYQLVLTNKEGSYGPFTFSDTVMDVSVFEIGENGGLQYSAMACEFTGDGFVLTFKDEDAYMDRYLVLWTEMGALAVIKAVYAPEGM